jgi:hypothetical protein
MNVDRHLGNFGIIRDVETLRWIDIAPNFDSGQAMHSQSEIYSMNFEDGSCKFFSKTISFSELLRIVLKDNKKIEIDFDKLHIVAEEWKNVLLEYQGYSNISDEVIDALYRGFKNRIRLLEQEYIK